MLKCIFLIPPIFCKIFPLPRCEECGDWMMTREPLDWDSEWECAGCEARLASEEVEALVTGFSDQVKRLYEEDR